MNRGRSTADAPLWFLAAVAIVFVGVEAALAVRHSLSPAYDPFVACETLVTTAAAQITTLGVLLPLGILTAVAIAAGLSLAHQLIATRSTLRRVLTGRRPAEGRLLDVARSLAIAERIDLVDDPTVFTFCHGLVRPRVCVSSGLVARLGDDELRAVLLHERHHLRHRDPLKILLGRTLASGLFFLPLAGALRRAYSAGKEMCADAEAIGLGDGLPLARALCVMLKSPRPVWPAGVLAIGALSPTEARLRGLLEPERPRRTWPGPLDWIASLAVAAGIFGFSYGAAAAAESPPLVEACAIDGAAAAPGDADRSASSPSAVEARDSASAPALTAAIGPADMAAPRKAFELAFTPPCPADRHEIECAAR